MIKRGMQTYAMEKTIYIADTYAIAGPKEGEGPLGKDFHKICVDDTCGCGSYEMAERQLCFDAVQAVIQSSQVRPELYCGGDLLNQIISTSFTARQIGLPYWGVYSACASFGQAVQTVATAIESGGIQSGIVSAVSHFSSAERQYRMPLEYGGQRPDWAQWTVTGAGAARISTEDSNQNGVIIKDFTIGKVMDLEVSDVDNMGAAMAPAAVDTVLQHLSDTGRELRYYDMVVTGDLAVYGSELFVELLKRAGIEAQAVHRDCGAMIYDTQNQNVYSGGSGAGCFPSVFCSTLYDKLVDGKVERMLCLPTGALLSTTSSQQGESIPCIAHAFSLEREKK
jgi:stage V sporulation protein AD